MHYLQNGSQVDVRPGAKPTVGNPGWFSESGVNGQPSWPGAEWFNACVLEFQNMLAARGIPYVQGEYDHLTQAMNAIGLLWKEGTVVTNSELVYVYKDAEGLPVEYYAPEASLENPVTMGETPDNNFDLAGKAQHISFQRSAVASAITQAIKINLQNKLDNWITVQDFGALGDGQSHPVSEIFSGLAAAQMAFPHVTSMDDELDWAAIQAAINSGKKLVQFDDDGSYVLNKPLQYDSQTTFYAPVPTISYGTQRTATFIIKRETWDGSDAIFTKRNRDSSYQSIIFDGLSFVGYANIVYNDLSKAEDIGVSALDITYIRDGAVIRNCSFDKLGWAVNQFSSAGYLGFCVIENCHISRCYKAICAYPSTRLTVQNTRIYDCYDWISSNSVLVINTSFNNSSYSSDECGIHADNIHSIGCWYEGGNRWFDTSASANIASIKIEGGFVSEAMSDGGATKVMID